MTRYDDSQDLSGSLLDQATMTSSFNAASAHSRLSDSLISQLTQEPGMDTFRNEFVLSLGNPTERSDSLRGSAAVMKTVERSEPLFDHKESPPLVLAGIPTDAGHDPLSTSRRDSVPISSSPYPSSADIDYNVTRKRVSLPPPQSSAEQQQILDSLNQSRRASAPVNYDYSFVPLKPDPKSKSKRSAGRYQPTDTMDRLRAAYERTFCNTSMDDISALTLDIDQNNSALEKSNNSGGASNDSDSFLEEFSVPDFSMGTGDAIKSYRKAQKMTKVQSPVPNQKVAPVESKRPAEKPRPSQASPKVTYGDFAEPRFGGDGVCKQKAAMMVHKPQPRPAAGISQKKDL